MSLHFLCLPAHLRIIVVGCFFVAIASAANAQVPAPPPVFPAVDENGVDVATGAFNFAQTDVVIGQPGAGGLAYTRFLDSGVNAYWSNNHTGYITVSGTTCSVVIGTHTETFNTSLGSCGTVSKQKIGSTLSYNSGTGQWTYTMRDGTVVLFSSMSFGGVSGYYMYGMPYAIAGLTRITSPTGDVVNYLYDSTSTVECIPDPENCWEQIVYYYGRLASVSTNTGNILFFQYTAPVGPTAYRLSKVTGVNRAVEYCTGADCSASWPSATYTYSSGLLASTTDATGMLTTYGYAGNRVNLVQFPDNAAHKIDVTYNGSGRVQTINRGYGSWRGLAPLI